MIQSSYYTSYAREQRVIDELVAHLQPHDLPQAEPVRDLTLDTADIENDQGAVDSIRLFKPGKQLAERRQPLREAVSVFVQEARTQYLPAAQTATYAIYDRIVELLSSLTQCSNGETPSMPSVEPIHLAIEPLSIVEDIPIRITPTQPPQAPSASIDAAQQETSMLMLTVRIVIAKLFGTYNIVDTQAS